MAQRGVSLIEVLVAVVILTIGLLGLAGLQASSLKVASSSHYRAQAAQAAYDMADRIRANLKDARTTPSLYSRSLGAVTPTGTAAADDDVREWLLRVQALPAGDGAVGVNGNLATITVQWDDRRGAARDLDPAGAQNARLTLVTQLWSN